MKILTRYSHLKPEKSELQNQSYFSFFTPNFLNYLEVHIVDA